MSGKRQDANLLEPTAQVSSTDEPNVWVARSEAIVIPLKRKPDREEAIEHVRSFLERAAGGTDVSMDDVYPFRAIAASDGIDSYFTKQDVSKALKPMAADFAAGRSVLGNHDYETFSYGSTIDGKVVAANVDAPEYEPSFYGEVIKAKPELATSKWLQTEAYVIRGLDLNGNKSDSLIKGMELGGIRRISISFVVGRYVCGIDGKDMLQGWFGDPYPEDPWDENPEMCSHFPGVEYPDVGYAFAIMENNRALEQSMVYMNSSPSAMLLRRPGLQRKAEAMAARGLLDPKQRATVEQRFAVRLPSFDRRAFVVAKPDDTDKEAVAETKEEAMSEKAHGRLTVVTTTDGKGTETVKVTPDANDPATAINVELKPGETLEQGGGGMGPGGKAASAEAERSTQPTPETETDLRTHLTATPPDGHGETVEAPATVDEMTTLHSSLHSGETANAGHSHGTASEAVKPEAAREVTTPETDEATEDEEAEEPVEPTAQTVTQAFVDSTQRLVAFAVRMPEAFASDEMAAVYAAERSVEQALADLGAERTVAADVTRLHETRDKVLRDVLGTDLTVEAVRKVMAEASDGREAKDQRVRDTIAARIGVQGEKFDRATYEAMLRTQDMPAIQSELDAWKEAKRERFTAGRSVIPRDIKDGKVARRAPARPADKPAASEEPNILSPRSAS
jgi:hypothetical protein